MGQLKKKKTELDLWQERLLKMHPTEIELGLDRIQKVFKRLNIKNKALKIVIGGTNGKGSTSAILESILLAAGYQVAVYSSPHLIKYNERFRINGADASDNEIITHLEKVQKEKKQTSLTYFEHTTLAAFSLFNSINLDIWILEVGLGGRLDAVNLIDADCSILTSIDIDHQEYLSNDLETIGAEKAAIFRTNRPAICAEPNPPQSVLNYAREIGCPLWLINKDFNYQVIMQQWRYQGQHMQRSALPYPALRGSNQLTNATAALAALESLRDQIAVPVQDIKKGLLNIRLAGRFQVLPGQPVVILDVAHNPQAMIALAHNLQQIPTSGRTIAVLGMLKDKDIVEALTVLVSRTDIDEWYCVSLDTARGLTANKLSTFVNQAYANQKNVAITEAAFSNHSQKPTVRPRAVSKEKPQVQIKCFDSIQQGYQAAKRHSTVNDKIIVFGSFLTVGPVLALLENTANKPN